MSETVEFKDKDGNIIEVEIKEQKATVSIPIDTLKKLLKESG